MPEEHPLKVTKDGGKVDAITASTISSRAFIDAMERAYRAFMVLTEGSAVEASDKATETTNESPAVDTAIADSLAKDQHQEGEVK